jgi:hypothetical protein
MDLAAIYDSAEFQETVDYTPHRGAMVTGIRADFDFGANLTPYDGGLATVAIVRVRASDVPSPKIYDEFTRSNGEVWTVRQIISHEELEWVLSCDTDHRQLPREMRR